MYTSAKLQDDREIMMEAVKQYGSALKYASAALKEDHEIVLEATKQDKALHYVLNLTSDNKQKQFIINSYVLAN